MRIHLNLSKARVSSDVRAQYIERAQGIASGLFNDDEPMTGWVNLPNGDLSELIDSINETADKVRSICDTFVVIGIGGSYLGAAAVLDAVGGPREGCPEILFAGQNLSGPYMMNVLNVVRNRDVCLCVVSKSGTTMETSIAFEILKAEMESKYGDGASDRIICITDPEKGNLRKLGTEKGYAMFDIPDNIGGRYSSFTPATLIPLAVAGLRIDRFLEGAKEIANEKFWVTGGLRYALNRYSLLNRGKEIEIFEYYNPQMEKLGEWMKQLFGESEGKEGRGLFPVSLTFPTDLHSIGQYLQEGKQIFFETVINISNWKDDVYIPESIEIEGLGGRSLNEVSQIALKGVVLAHSKVDIPIIQIDVDTNSEYSIGQLLYFMMMTAAITGKLMRIDPFTQDGVEKYKAEITSILTTRFETVDGD